MNSVNDIFRSFGPEYLQHYGNRMPKTHRKVIDAMMACLPYRKLRPSALPVRTMRRVPPTLSLLR
jgi:hypothetical protein